LTGVSAVVLNLTATDTTEPSFVTAYPAGQSRPPASNLNWAPGETVPNRAVVQLGSGGRITLYNNAGSVDVVADVNGYFTDKSDPSATGSTFHSLVPARITDTRVGSGQANAGGTSGPTSILKVQVANAGGVPPLSASVPPVAAVLNVTATNTSGPASFLTVYPSGQSPPLASDINWSAAGVTVPNLVIVGLGPDGSVNIYNNLGSVDVVVDVVGWYG